MAGSECKAVQYRVFWFNVVIPIILYVQLICIEICLAKVTIGDQKYSMA